MKSPIPKQEVDSKSIDHILTIAQQSFILQALQAGMSTDSIRKILKIDYLRVIEISKHLKQAQRRLPKEE